MFDFINQSSFITRNFYLQGKACLSKDFDYIKERINQIAKDKYKDIYGEDIEENINVKFLLTHPKKVLEC